jgi:hypothetical protein
MLKLTNMAVLRIFLSYVSKPSCIENVYWCKLCAIIDQLVLYNTFIFRDKPYVYILYSGYRGESDVSLDCVRFYGPLVRPRISGGVNE